MDKNYSKVQFISWEINTGPYVLGSLNRKTWGYYSGIRVSDSDDRTDALSQCLDIDARIAFTADAINKALKMCDPDTKTLKIFMAPEFLYRGAGGAYLHDLINGWIGDAPAEYQLPAPYNKAWSGLFGQLQAFVADDKFSDWLFVFGSAVSSSFKPYKAEDDHYYIDPSLPAEIYNTSLIQRGGKDATKANYASRKHYKSGIDFLTWNVATLQHIDGSVLPLDPSCVLPLDAMGECESSAVFRIAGINDSKGTALDFGLEICLDHALSNAEQNHWGRIRTAGAYVKIQLVPSCGMSLVPASIRLQANTEKSTVNSYAFNCDGLGSLDFPYHAGSHTQIWNGSNGEPVLPSRKLIETCDGQVALQSSVSKVASSVVLFEGTPNRYLVQADHLWNDGNTCSGAGTVRVVDALSL
jgi:hypothetical protein